MLSTNVLLRGTDAPAPQPLVLRAGPLALIFLAGDLRYVRLGERELLRRVYVAVRDANWGTVPAAITDLQTEVAPDRFRITYRATHKHADVHFVWHAEIAGTSDGTVTFTMAGEARSTFRRNRIGFCVLHPMTLAGRACQIAHTDGTVTAGHFPIAIAPHQPFQAIRAITHDVAPDVAPGLRAEVRLTGDVFEMEDQRNWTDASFKTYSTPLAEPFPVTVAQGTRIAQSVTLRLRGEVPAELATDLAEDASLIAAPVGTAASDAGPAAGPDRAAPAGVVIEIADAPEGVLPHLGLGAASHGRPLTDEEIARLRALHLSHLRVDLQLGCQDWRAALTRGAAEAAALGAALELAVFPADVAESDLHRDLAALAAALESSPAPIARVLLLPAAPTTTPPAWLATARQHLAPVLTDVALGGGTNAYFTELNRNRPPQPDHVDVVAYALTPQVHACDDLSLIETLPAQAVTAHSARTFLGATPLAIAPITLKPRFNPDATGPEPPPAPGELPSQVDVRQMSLLGAAWTLGSVKYLAEAGVGSLTYYETTGPRGIMASDTPAPHPFPAPPGTVYPVYHLWADLVADPAGARVRVVPTLSHAPHRVVALTLEQSGHRRILVANMTAAPQIAHLRGLPAAVRLRTLDATNAEAAMTDPVTFRRRPAASHPTTDGTLRLELAPYALVTLDG